METLMITGDAKTRHVFIGGERLHHFHSQRISNHSPDGYNWGYCGSGPAQLALAILQKVAGDNFARQNYQKFKFDVIAGLPQGQDFHLDMKLVEKWIKDNLVI